MPSKEKKTDLSRKLLFTWAEFSGGLGDLGLFLPLVAGMVVAGDLDMGTILVLTGLMNILIGLIFRRPIPIQPMKAIAAVAITEGLTRGELASTGIIMGIIFLFLGMAGLMDRLARLVPMPIVRGIQLGLGVKLIILGTEWIVSELPLVGWNSAMTAMIAGLILIILAIRKLPGLIIVFLGGFLILNLADPSVFQKLSFGLPELKTSIPVGGEWASGFLRGALPQLPLTLLNSVVALCVLCGDYFPKDRISPGRVGISIGLMNLISAPLGCIPLCHGAGGLAAQYRFGARSGGSVVMLGALKIIAGLIFGASLVVLIGSYPLSILGPMIILAGFELARSIKDMETGPELLVAVLMGLSIVIVNTLTGFVLGLAFYCIVIPLARYLRPATRNGSSD